MERTGRAEYYLEITKLAAAGNNTTLFCMLVGLMNRATTICGPEVMDDLNGISVVMGDNGAVDPDDRKTRENLLLAAARMILAIRHKDQETAKLEQERTPRREPVRMKIK